MASKNTKTGIVVLILFALGLGAWTYFNPSHGPVSGAGFLGGGRAQPSDKVSPGPSGPSDGFKGSDEELQAVTADR